MYPKVFVTSSTCLVPQGNVNKYIYSDFETLIILRPRFPGIDHMHSRTDTAGHTKVFIYPPVKDHFDFFMFLKN